MSDTPREFVDYPCSDCDNEVTIPTGLAADLSGDGYPKELQCGDCSPDIDFECDPPTTNE